MAVPADLFANPAFKADPYPFYAQARAEAPVQKARLPNGVTVYLVTRYEDVQAGLKDPRLIKNIQNARQAGILAKLGLQAMGNNSNMLKADPPQHTRLRALAHAAFTPKYVNGLRGHIQAIADELLDAAIAAVQDRGQIDLIKAFAFPLPITVICEMLGVPKEDDAKIRRWSGQLIQSGILSSEHPRPSRTLLSVINYIRGLIAKRRRKPQSDLISQLIHVDQGGDHFTPRELVGTVLVLLIAGHETTVNLIGNGTLALLQHPEQMEALKKDPALIKPAVEELLRYVNPVQFVNRYAAEDLEISGVAIPRGSHLAMVVAAANHDPAYAHEPEQLDVQRSDTRHVAFGQGIHYCLGAPLARLEGEIAFTTLLKRLPNLRLAPGTVALDWRASFELRRLNSLPVVF